MSEFPNRVELTSLKPSKEICQRCSHYVREKDLYRAEVPYERYSYVYGDCDLDIYFHGGYAQYLRTGIKITDFRFRIPQACPFILEHTLENGHAQ